MVEYFFNGSVFIRPDHVEAALGFNKWAVKELHAGKPLYLQIAQINRDYKTSVGQAILDPNVSNFAISLANGLAISFFRKLFEPIKDQNRKIVGRKLFEFEYVEFSYENRHDFERQNLVSLIPDQVRIYKIEALGLLLNKVLSISANESRIVDTFSRKVLEQDLFRTTDTIVGRKIEEQYMIFQDIRNHSTVVKKIANDALVGFYN